MYFYNFGKLCPLFSICVFRKNSGLHTPESVSFPLFSLFYPNRFFSAAIPSASTAALLASWIWR